MSGPRNRFERWHNPTARHLAHHDTTPVRPMVKPRRDWRLVMGDALDVLGIAVVVALMIWAWMAGS